MRRRAPGDTSLIGRPIPRGRRLATAVVAAALLGLIAAPLRLADPAPTVVAAAAICTGWTSETAPPETIRVLRTDGPADGTVQVVPFRGYVNVVMAAEWGPSNPREALRAGAVAVKEYAWYQTMRWRGRTGPDGQCYDVVDSTVDQVYAPETHDPAATLVAAVDATWPMTVVRSGHLFSTHYQGGADVACGADVDGTWLYQRSAMRCARDGMSADDILRLYYGHDVVVVGGTADPGASPSPTPTITPSPTPIPAPTLGIDPPASTIAWGETARFDTTLDTSASGAPLVGRTLRLESTLDGVAWEPVGAAATDDAGLATFVYRPIANRWYRAVLEAAPDLPGATSPTVRVTVRQRVSLTPDGAGAAAAIRRGATVAFTVLVRPARPETPPGPVTVEAWRLAGRTWTRASSRTVSPDASGRVVVRVAFDATGSWFVRARAASTATNANSAWTPLRRYRVR